MDIKNNSYLNSRVTHRIVVKSEIDELGHVNNAEYVKWIQEAAIEHWYSVAADEHLERYIWFCSRHEIDYKQQLFENDQIEIKTWLGEANGARFDRYVDIRAVGAKKVAVLAKTTWVLIDKNKGIPTRLSPKIIAIFK